MNTNKDGGYDSGYKLCPCFWGHEPGSLVLALERYRKNWVGANILDLGCGEGKNAMHFSSLGANVTAVDISAIAISNGKSFWEEHSKVKWIQADVLDVEFPSNMFDVVLLYGLPHCLANSEQVTNLISKAQNYTKQNGYIALATFNLRYQELEAHPGFKPLLQSHDFYVNLFEGWKFDHLSDSDLIETHPHNKIKHTHSLTRILAQKVIK